LTLLVRVPHLALHGKNKAHTYIEPAAACPPINLIR
jgi:hypothetical protein